MNQDRYDRDQLEKAICEILDHESPDQSNVAELAALLDKFPESHHDYLEILSIHSMLEESRATCERAVLEDAGHISTLPSVQRETATSRWTSTATAWLVPVAAVLMIGVVIWWSNSARDQRAGGNKLATKTPADSHLISGDEATSEFVTAVKDADSKTLYIARVTQLENAEWRNEERLTVGQVLDRRRLDLISGEAEITFDSGAAVTILGPASLSLVSVHAAIVHSGKAWADVPEPAIGFTIDTPTAKVEDLGTRFSVNVSKSGSSDVAVLEGEVRIESLVEGGPERVIRENQAIRARVTPSERNTIKFDDLEFSNSLSTEKQLKTYSSGDRVPFYLWSFDSLDAIDLGFWEESGWHDSAKTFPAKINSSKHNNTPVRPEDVNTGVSSVQGVHGHAIRMNGNGIFLETELPGIPNDNARTICFWTKIPKRSQLKNAYSIISWGNASKRGGKWQIGWNARSFSGRAVIGAIRTEVGRGFVVGSNDLRDGKWHHVAVVYIGGNDSQSRGDIRNRIRMYVDGKLERLSVFANAPVNTKTGGASSRVSFGKFLGANPNSRFRTFRGSLDEIFLFEGALTPKQISCIIDSNTPPKPSEIIPVRHTEGSRN